MSEIRFFIPKDETIPTDLRLFVGDVWNGSCGILKKQ